MLEEYNQANNDLEIIAINLTRNDNVEAVNKFVKDNGYSYSMVMDLDSSISNPYKIEYIPFIVILDEKGLIRYKGSAPTTVESLKSLVKASIN